MAALAPLLGLGLPQAARANHAPPLGEERGDEPRDDEARDNPQLERAMEAFRRGMAAYNEARYEEALASFQDAATLYASPDFQYNIGLCYEKLDKPDEAIRAFETYLRTKPDAADRANVEDRIARLRARLEAPQTEPEPIEEDIEPITTDQVAPSPRGTPLIVTGGVLTGLGSALALGGGLAFGLVAKQRSDAIHEIQDGGNPSGATLADAREIERQGKRFEVMQITFIAAGAAVAITGVALLAVGAKRRKQASTARIRVAPGISGFSLVGRF